MSSPAPDSSSLNAHAGGVPLRQVEPPPPPLFILGSPRSFTSLINGMLGQHPQAYGMPELNLFVTDSVRDLIEEFAGYRQIQIHGLMRVVAQLYGAEQSLVSVDMAKRWMLTRLDHSTQDVYLELCERVAPLRVVDKSPVYSSKPEYLARLMEAFPDAYFLHLLRHPRTQGVSIMKIAKGMMAILSNSVDYSADPPVVDPQISWLDVQQNIVEALANVPAHRQMTLRGEDVLNAPSSALRKICRWLGLRTDDEALEAMMHPEDSPYASLGPLGAHLGNDINYLRSPALRHARIRPSSLEGPLPWRQDDVGFSDEVRAMAERFGYS
ncbi:MAG: sulfotransferase [Pseudomonadota bacterium]